MDIDEQSQPFILPGQAAIIALWLVAAGTFEDGIQGFIGIFFPLLTNIIFGVKKIDQNLIDAAKTLGANRVQIFLKVMIPSAIPYLMNGIKVGLGVGWMCIVAAEMYSPVSIGVGYCLSSMCQNSLWPSVFAILVVIAIMGIMTTSLAEYVQKRISKRMGME